jgi:glutathione S-transferase
MTIADLAVFPVLTWITSSITTPEALRPYPLLSSLMKTIEGDPRVAGYYKMEKEREKRKEAAAGTAAADAGASGKGGH